MDKIEIAVQCEAALGESPVWDEHQGRLHWVDILAGKLHWLQGETHDSETLVAPLPAVVPGPHDGAELILGQDTLLRRSDSETLALARVTLPQPNMRFNDAKCDPSGRLWAGTMSNSGDPVAALYCIDSQLRISQCRSGLTISNGLGWSSDGSLMYHVDTPTRQIDAFAFDPETGELGRRHVLAEIEPNAGLPDGLCVDAEGFIWVALWGGGAVRRYAPNGTLDGMLEIPTRFPTSCAFGGTDLDVLYVTSSRQAAINAGADTEHAGALFRASVGVRGTRPDRFAVSEPHSL